MARPALLLVLCALLVACGGATKHVVEPDDDDDDDELPSPEHDRSIEPVIAGPQPPLTATEDDLVAALQRSACFGPCPIYNVSVYRTGEVRYEGIAHVRVRGIVIDRVSPKTLVLLDEHFAAHHFAAMAGEWNEDAATDHPTVTTWYRAPGGELLATIHNHGIRGVEHRKLDEIEEGVDRIVETERWTGTAARRAKFRE